MKLIKMPCLRPAVNRGLADKYIVMSTREE